MQHAIRTLSALAVAASTVAMLATPRSAAAQEDRRPTVAVLDFTNGSFGPGRAEYDALGKGIQDYLITELAGNTRIRVVERDRIQKIIEEQNLCRDGRCDDAAIVKLGKILGAHHMIAGGFIADPKGNMVLNARAFNTETSQIEHTDKVNDKAENFIAAIGNLASKLNSGMKLPDIRRVASTGGSERAATTPVNTPSEKASATPATMVTKEAPPEAATATPQQFATAQPATQAKVPYAAIMLYSKALSAKDKGDKPAAVVLFRQAIAKFPDFEKAKSELKKVEG